MFTYKPLNLPTIPDSLLETLEESLGALQLENSKINYSYRISKNNELVNPAQYERWSIPNELVAWIRDNIEHDFEGVGYAVTYGHGDHVPHTDLVGNVKINYIIDTGGDNVVTTWYETVDPNVPAGYRPTKFEELKPIDQVVLKPKTWYMLNTQIIHGVQNITSKRKQITITCFKNINDVI